jgi:hypothetical protein
MFAAVLFIVSCYAGCSWEPEGRNVLPHPRELFPTGRRSCLFGSVASILEAVCKMISLKSISYYLKTNFKKIVQTSLYSSTKLGC